ncbi:MAG: TonB family protein [Sphingomonas sp.]
MLKPLALALLLPFAVPAQAQESDSFAATGNWNIVKLPRGGCVAETALGGDANPTLALMLFAGGRHGLTVTGTGWKQEAAKSYRVKLTIGTASFTVPMDGQAADEVHGVSGLVEQPVFDALVGAATVRMDDGGTPGTVFTLTPASTSRAHDLLRRCVLERGQVDPGSGKPPVTHAEPLASATPLITTQDYPPDALRQEATGTAAARVTVSAQGKVSGCDILRTSGYESLDIRTCYLLALRARFTPAKDADGAPTQDLITRLIEWRFQE